VNLAVVIAKVLERSGA